MENTRSLKSLNVTKGKLLRNIAEARKTGEQAAPDLKHYKKELEKIDAQILEIENDPTIKVTEHALLRYLERFEGIDLNYIAEQIKLLPPEQIVKKGFTIVTCYRPGEYPPVENIGTKELA